MREIPNLIGKHFGRWTVIDNAESRGRYRYWHCVCSCGNDKDVKERSLINGKSKSCGCLQKEVASKFCTETKRDNLIGKRFGRLEVIKRIGYNNEHHTTVWLCRCDCGTIKEIEAMALNSGKTRSCGCLKSEVTSYRAKTHGDSNSRLYSIWAGMKNRCYNKNIPEYRLYGERGITICQEWIESYSSFRKWALENGYEEGLSIDRIDNNGNYCPENCRWATNSQQCNNRRSNVLITYNNETHTATEWAMIIGVNSKALTKRKKRGWSDTECIEIPVRKNANQYIRKNIRKDDYNGKL